MNRCKDCANFNIQRVRRCIAYNNDVSSHDDATYCCEFVPIRSNKEENIAKEGG